MASGIGLERFGIARDPGLASFFRFQPALAFRVVLVDQRPLVLEAFSLPGAACFIVQVAAGVGHHAVGARFERVVVGVADLAVGAAAGRAIEGAGAGIGGYPRTVRAGDLPAGQALVGTIVRGRETTPLNFAGSSCRMAAASQ